MFTFIITVFVQSSVHTYEETDRYFYVRVQFCVGVCIVIERIGNEFKSLQ